MIFGLIPAAGKSVRMGRPKLALPLGGGTVLGCVLEALRVAGIEQTLVVVGPHVPELVPIAAAAGANVLVLGDETPDMRATTERGLAWLEQRFKPQADDTFLLVPADHPTLDAAVIRALSQARKDHVVRSIFIPTFEGKRGHPTLIGWRHVTGIRTHPGGQGLNTYLRSCANETLEVVVLSGQVLCDLDTPEDYEALRRGWDTEQR
jgi:molybdenum cofactor cytidylyltransferase